MSMSGSSELVERLSKHTRGLSLAGRDSRSCGSVWGSVAGSPAVSGGPAKARADRSLCTERSEPGRI